MELNNWDIMRRKDPFVFNKKYMRKWRAEGALFLKELYNKRKILFAFSLFSCG